MTHPFVEELRQEGLGAMTEIEAAQEGYPSLEMYRDLILRMHPGMERRVSGLDVLVQTSRSAPRRMSHLVERLRI